MEKKNKGLVDDHEHGIILNESGTSVSFGWDAGEDETEEGGVLPNKEETQAATDATAKPDNRQAE